MLACASSVPSFGANSPTAIAEPRVALFTCRGRHMGALPLGPDEAFSALQAKRLKSLDDGALAAPSHARVVITYRSIRPTYPICRPRPLPDAPAGQILPSELGGPRRRKWGAIDSDFLTEGEGGARLAIARLERVPSWPGTGHKAAKGTINAPRSRLFLALDRLPLGYRILFSTLRNVPCWLTPPCPTELQCVVFF